MSILYRNQGGLHIEEVRVCFEDWDAFNVKDPLLCFCLRFNSFIIIMDIMVQIKTILKLPLMNSV